MHSHGGGETAPAMGRRLAVTRAEPHVRARDATRMSSTQRERRDGGKAMPERRRGRTGRPSALTPEVAARIVDAVAAGNHITTACEAAGVSRSAVYAWLARADEAREVRETGGSFDRTASDFLDFQDRCR